MYYGQFAKGMFYGMFTVLMLLSFHADYLGQEKYIRWVIETWGDTNKWRWVIYWIIGTILFYYTTFTIGK